MTETAWKTIPKAENHENKIMRQKTRQDKKRITIYVLTKLSDLKVKV